MLCEFKLKKYIGIRKIGSKYFERLNLKGSQRYKERITWKYLRNKV